MEVTEWESPVTLRMPFNGGIGQHDAPWQTNFGGDWYLEHGSRLDVSIYSMMLQRRCSTM